MNIFKNKNVFKMIPQKQMFSTIPKSTPAETFYRERSPMNGLNKKDFFF